MIKQKKILWAKRVDELYAKEILTIDQHTSLIEMINSPDDENFSLVEEILKQNIKLKLSESLNSGQTDAFYKIIDFIDNPSSEAMVLKGYAGTGKTFLVKRLIEYIAQTDHKKKIAVAAPTNKAVRILYMNSPSNIEGMNAYMFDDIFDIKSRLIYSTIHKLLGMKEVISDTGQISFLSDSMNSSDLSKYDFLIVDEVSMLDDKLCIDIMKYSKNLRIIFMGDPAQIPPIGKIDSIPFNKTPMYNFDVCELTEIMRQKEDNPIIKLSFDIRNNLSKERPISKILTNLNSDGNGIICLDSINDKDQIKPILNKYFNTELYADNTDYMKVIAWRNKTVDYINNIVRELIYGKDIPKYMIGEKLIVSKSIFEKSTLKKKHYEYENWSIKFSTSEELEVVNVEEIVKRMHETNGLKMILKFYKLTVKCYNPMKNETINTEIFVIHDEDFFNYKNLLAHAHSTAVTSKLGIDWVHYFNIKKWSAEVSYNYAITGHKAQGSTYENVLILEDDLDENKDIVERNRIKYTVFTRSTNKLFILRKN